MQLPPAAVAARLTGVPATIDKSPGYGCIFRLRRDLADPSALPLSTRTALAAADAVLYDGDADPRVLALARCDAFVEPVSRGDGRMAAGVAITRMRKLVSEGWRVVWLASSDTVLSPAAILGDSGAVHICGEICPHAQGAGPVPAHAPHNLATAFNGLAG
jgi:hypothetical protein